MRRSVATGMMLMLMAGAGAGAAMWAVPVGQLEMWIASAGISEMIHAAAPPLGQTARLAISGIAGLCAMAGVALTVPTGTRQSHQITQHTGSNMGLGSKIIQFARGRASEDVGQAAAPSLRRADAHPDAPARAPIFASRDLGADAFENVVPQSAMVSEPSEILTGAEPQDLQMPRAPEPLPLDAVRAEVARLEECSPRPLPLRAHRPSDELAGLGLSELTQRLEDGLARRTRVVEATDTVPVPVMSAPVSMVRPVAVDHDAEGDAALQAALATLRSITAKAG